MISRILVKFSKRLQDEIYKTIKPKNAVMNAILRQTTHKLVSCYLA